MKCSLPLVSDFYRQLMTKQDVVIGFEFLETAVHDGAFALIVRNPSACFGLFSGMVAHLHQGVDDKFKRIHIVVDE